MLAKGQKENKGTNGPQKVRHTHTHKRIFSIENSRTHVHLYVRIHARTHAHEHINITF